MDIWLDVSRNEIHYVAGIIPTLKWRGGKLGVRLAFLPKDISKLFSEYREVYSAARKTEKAKEKVKIRLYPKNLCEFLEKNLNTYFSIKTFILNPAKAEADEPQTTPFGMECFTDNPLKGIIKVDMIDAQREVADPDNADGTERTKKQFIFLLMSPTVGCSVDFHLKAMTGFTASCPTFRLFPGSIILHTPFAISQIRDICRRKRGCADTGR